MATAPAVQGHRTFLHTRGSWSARDDRVPSAMWLGILWIGMIAGFGLDIPGFVRRNPPEPRILYVHAFVFTVWLLILTAQVLFVVGDRVAWHKKLGWFAAGWAGLMAVLGPWAGMASASYFLGFHFAGSRPVPSTPQFLSINLVDIAGFLGLLVWGFTLRKNPAAHRRMMMLTTISLADPGFARITGHLLHAAPHSGAVLFVHMFYGNVLLVALMTAWDWWRGRLMRSFVWGAAALLASEFLASALYFWGPWKALTLAAVQAWARL